MSVKIEAISGPDDATFIYLKGTHNDNPAFVRVNSVKRSAVAADPARIFAERDLLVSQVEQAYAEYVASQEALANL